MSLMGCEESTLYYIYYVINLHEQQIVALYMSKQDYSIQLRLNLKEKNFCVT